MRITKMIFLMLSSFSLLSLFSCVSPIYEGSFSIDKNLTEEQIKDAVSDTVAELGWYVEFPSKGVYRVHIQRRDHTATFDTICKESFCNIKYVDSTNLEYNASEKVIHSNYNKWVKTFVKNLSVRVRP